MKHTIYLFSGTGNNLYIANRIKNHFSEVEIINIGKADFNKINQCDAEKVGIIFPTYFMDAADIVKDFVKTLNITNKDAYIYAIATCGYEHGNGLGSINSKLKNHGSILSAGYCVKMPDSSIVITNPERLHSSIYETADNDIDKILKDIEQKNHNQDGKKNNLIRTFAGFTFQRIFNLTLGFNKIQCDRELCISCGLCAKVCPVDNIKMVDNKPGWGSNCVSCLSCVHNCPKSATNYKRQNIKKPYKYRNAKTPVSELIKFNSN